MKHTVTTYLTKSAIVACLKNLMQQKALNKISISELCRNCEINRKTFYYHFSDIYDIVSWMFVQDLKDTNEFIDYEDAIQYAIEYSRENKVICNSLLEDPIGCDMIRSYIKNKSMDRLRLMISDFCKVHDVHHSEPFQDFLINYYSDGFAAYLIKIIKNGNITEHEIKNSAQYLTIILEATMPAVLQAPGANL